MKTPDEIATAIRKRAEYEGAPSHLTINGSSYGRIVVSDERHNDVAEFFCDEYHNVPRTRAEALANARRFAASERMLAALQSFLEPWGDAETVSLRTGFDLPPHVAEAFAVIKAARGGA